MNKTYDTLLAQSRNESTKTLRISLNAVDQRRVLASTAERRALNAISSAIIEVLIEREPDLNDVLEDWAEDMDDNRTGARLVLDWFEYVEAVTA